MHNLFQDHAFFTPLSGHHITRCSGADTRSFLHRMSTQELNALTAGDGTLNCFVNQKGRMVDLVHHLQIQDDLALLVGHCAVAGGLSQWLDQFHFIEQIAFEDLTPGSQAFLCLGGGATQALASLTSQSVDLQPWQFLQHENCYVVRTFDHGASPDAMHPAYLVFHTDADGASLEEALTQAGASPCSPAQLQDVRVLSGVPHAPQEVNDSVTPLALGLHDAISWSKGCYIGQEVIARMDTYDRVTKNLALLAANENTVLSPAMDIYLGEKVVGQITSSTNEPQAGQHFALALLKLKEPEFAGAELHVNSNGNDVATTIMTRAAAQTPHD
ncbi:MAG: hypothetical protein CMH56_13640 [Myxococcales bacterium]|nr:hypothetical protein [Myxococcales bacterium]